MGLLPLPHARIDHGEVHRPLRKCRVRRLQGERCFPDVLGADLMGQVDNLRLGVHLQDNPLHACSEGVPTAIIRGERDDG